MDEMDEMDEMDGSILAAAYDDITELSKYTYVSCQQFIYRKQ